MEGEINGSVYEGDLLEKKWTRMYAPGLALTPALCLWLAGWLWTGTARGEAEEEE